MGNQYIKLKEFKKKSALSVVGIYFLALVSNVPGIVLENFSEEDDKTYYWQSSPTVLTSFASEWITNFLEKQKFSSIWLNSIYNHGMLTLLGVINPVSQDVPFFVFLNRECGRSPPLAV